MTDILERPRIALEKRIQVQHHADTPTFASNHLLQEVHVVLKRTIFRPLMHYQSLG